MSATDQGDKKMLFNSNEAAEYLGVTLAAIKWHVHTSKKLKPEKFNGKALIFTKAELERFKTVYNKPGPQPNEDQEPKPPKRKYKKRKKAGDDD